MRFKIIPGFTSYEINSDGTIVRDRTTKSAIKQFCFGSYTGVRIQPDDGHSTVHQYIHRLVAMAWISATGPTFAHNVVAHIDGSSDKNHFKNLRWSTRRENFYDAAYKHRSFVPRMMAGRRRFSDAEIRAIRADPRTQKETAKFFRTGQSAISYIKRRIVYKDVE